MRHYCVQILPYYFIFHKHCSLISFQHVLSSSLEREGEILNNAIFPGTRLFPFKKIESLGLRDKGKLREEILQVCWNSRCFHPWQLFSQTLDAAASWTWPIISIAILWLALRNAAVRMSRCCLVATSCRPNQLKWEPEEPLGFSLEAAVGWQNSNSNQMFLVMHLKIPAHSKTRWVRLGIESWFAELWGYFYGEGTHRGRTWAMRWLLGRPESKTLTHLLGKTIRLLK